MKTMTVDQELDAIDEGYEYLMAYASNAQDTDDMEATEYIKDVQESLEEIILVLDDLAEKRDDGHREYFNWTVEQTEFTVTAITLFLENTETTPEKVNALLSTPALRNSVTTIMYLAEINGL